MEQRHERYIISEAEVELLDRYEAQIINLDDESRYDRFSAETLASFCRMKDRSNDLFIRRYLTAREVIDQIARLIGIDPDTSGFWLYAPDDGGYSPLLNRLDNYLSRSGEKTQLKRRVQELEQENALLRSLLQK